MSGIAEDTYNFALAILSPKLGVQDHVVTNGNAAQNIQLLKSVNRICPAITILNSGSSTVKVGWGGYPSFPLAAGTSITFRYKNPAAGSLVVNDGGTAATLDIMG